MYIGLLAKYSLFLSEFNETWNFCKDSRNIKILNSMKISPVEAQLFHADTHKDGRTDRQENITKLIVAFHSFAKSV